MFCTVFYCTRTHVFGFLKLFFFENKTVKILSHLGCGLPMKCMQAEKEKGFDHLNIVVQETFLRANYVLEELKKRAMTRMRGFCLVTTRQKPV